MYSSLQSEGVVGTLASAGIVTEECLGNTWDPLSAVESMNFTEANRISSYSDIRLSLDHELGGLSQRHLHNKRKNVSFQNVTVEEQHDASLPSGKDENKQKNELSPGSSNHRASSEYSKGSDASKDDYIHVRARRGQSTNSHSLAERVRREKISERMRLLRGLVPGCNKINGKAMMLDEIINYIQSLQCQVEFLSMKLAAVHPEMSFNHERIVSKDALQPCYGGTAVLGFDPGTSSFQPHLYASNFESITPYGMPCILPTSRDLQQASLSQHLSPWQNELHTMNPAPSEVATNHIGGFLLAQTPLRSYSLK